MGLGSGWRRLKGGGIEGAASVILLSSTIENLKEKGKNKFENMDSKGKQFSLLERNVLIAIST